MFVLGHLGIGSALAKPFSRKLPWGFILGGTLLPDLIDKPLFYFGYLTQGPGWSNVITGTRTVGHTIILAMMIALWAWIKRDVRWAAIALGVGTHLSLDLFIDIKSAASAVFWPALGWEFPLYPFESVGAHLGSMGRRSILLAELVGGVILTYEVLKRRGASQVYKKPKEGRSKGV